MARLILTRPYTPPPPEEGEGWTDFDALPRGTGTTYYVANGGTDAFGFGTIEAPFATVEYALTQTIAGLADWVLLKRGDTFSPSGTVTMNKSGPAGVWGENGYMRLGAYGTGARPRIMEQTLVLGPSFASAAPVLNVAIADVFLDADARLADGTSTSTGAAINFIASSFAGLEHHHRYIHIENVRIRGHAAGVAINRDAALGDYGTSDVRIYRCAVRDLFGNGGHHVNGFFVNACGPVDVLDVFGYRILAPDGPGDEWSTFDHLVYDQANGVAAGSQTRSYVGVIAIDTPDCVMQRSGGEGRRWLSISTLIPGTYGQAYSGTPTSGGNTADLSDCAFLDPIGVISPDQTDSFFVGNLNGGSVQRIMAVRTPATTVDWDIRLTAENGDNIGVQGVTFSDNWTSGQIEPTTGSGISGNTYTNNSENNGVTSWTLADVIADVEAAYGVTIGTTKDDLAEYLWAADKGNWNASHTSTAWINAIRARESLGAISA